MNFMNGKSPSPDRAGILCEARAKIEARAGSASNIFDKSALTLAEKPLKNGHQY
jgi:hypothetical protein